MKKVFFDYVFKLFLVWVLVSCLGCASKKKTTSSEVELHTDTVLKATETGAEIKTNTNVVATAKTVSNNTTTTTETNYKPIDPTKPSSVVTPEGKKYVLDNAEVTEKETRQSENKIAEQSKTDTSSNISNYWGKEISFIKLEDIRTQNNTSLDRSGFNMWSWLWVLFIIILAIGTNYLNNRFKLLSYVTSLFKRK